MNLSFISKFIEGLKLSLFLSHKRSTELLQKMKIHFFNVCVEHNQLFELTKVTKLFENGSINDLKLVFELSVTECRDEFFLKNAIQNVIQNACKKIMIIIKNFYSINL